MPDENIVMERNGERKELSYDSLEVAKLMHCGWKQVHPNPLDEAPAPHEGEQPPTDVCATEEPHSDK